MRRHRQELVEGLGIRLNSSNVDATLARMREGREAWRARHAGDVAEIEAMAADPANPAREWLALRRKRP